MTTGRIIVVAALGTTQTIAWGWRAGCLAWGGINLVLAAPLNWLAIPRYGTPSALPRLVVDAPTLQPPRADADPSGENLTFDTLT